MFTGIIQAVGEILSFENGILWIDSKDLILTPVQRGESIAVNGVCLTVVEESNRKLKFDLSPETIQKTTFGHPTLSKQVNLERALALGDRLGGHMVQGHVDSFAQIINITPQGNSTIFEFEISESKYLIDKGSVTLDGISLTVVGPTSNKFQVWVIPHTLAETNLSSKSIGDFVNLEFDMIPKYLERLLEPYK